MALTHINNRSDFQILLKMEEGKTFPEFDFSLAFQTTGGFRYNVKSDDSKRFTPNADRTQAVITFDFADGNYFPNGRLTYTIKADMQNAMFPDGYENTQTPCLLDIVIWDGASDYSDAVEVDFVLPYVSVQAKSVSPAMLDTSNVLRKRIPLGAMAYQLYYTNMVRIPNALAEQEQFDKEVPQWLSEFLKKYILNRASTHFSIVVQNDKGKNIGEISLTADKTTGAHTYDTKITFTGQYPSDGCWFYYLVLQQGVYYFDANRNLRVYCDESQYRQVERFLPNEPNLSEVKKLYAYSDEGFCYIEYANLQKVEHECYVRRRKNFAIIGENKKVRWYYYWRKTNRLRQLSNAPVKKSKRFGINQICLVRLRRLTYSHKNIYKKGCRVAARSKWVYFNIQVSGSTGKISVRYSRER